MMNLYPWQKNQWKNLWIERQSNRLSHALLLMGNKGFGKMEFAVSLAKTMLCEKKGEFSCQQCRSCQLFAVGNHPDFTIVNVEEKAKSIKVAQIRELISSLGQTAHHGDYQVVIIDPAEAMNRAAANALLKTLEEPSRNVLFLLISHQPGYLPLTIKSRCQRVVFSCKDYSTILTWLKQNLSGEQDAETLLKMADYAPLAALQFAKSNYLTLRDQLLTHFWKIHQNKVNAIVLVNDLLQQDLNEVLYAFSTIMMDLLRLQLKVSDQHIVNVDRLQPLQSLSLQVKRHLLLKLLDELQEAQITINRSMSINAQLLLESLFLKWENGVIL